MVVFGISFGFPKLSRCEGQIAHVLLTRSPLVYSRRSLTARLACVKHAASVRPEPGSNSPLTSVDSRREPAVESMEYPGKNAFSSPLGPRRLVVLPKEPSNGAKRPKPRRSVDGALNNSSSTFGTLLSSQGSCTHRRRPRGQASGQPGETYPSRVRQSNRLAAATRLVYA